MLTVFFMIIYMWVFFFSLLTNSFILFSPSYMRLNLLILVQPSLCYL